MFLVDIILHKVHKMKTLEDSKADWLHMINGDGGHCPCCNRWGKIYPRQFNSSMARALIWLVGTSQEWTDVPNTAPKWLTRTNQLPTVRWWGLAVGRESEDPAIKDSGMWRPTQRGIDFARGRVSVPKKVYTYNAEVLRFGKEHIRIAEAFKTRFDYEQVMLPVSSDQRSPFLCPPQENLW